jgi:hypothetical protein
MFDEPSFRTSRPATPRRRPTALPCCRSGLQWRHTCRSPPVRRNAPEERGAPERHEHEGLAAQARAGGGSLGQGHGREDGRRGRCVREAGDARVREGGALRVPAVIWGG